MYRTRASRKPIPKILITPSVRIGSESSGVRRDCQEMALSIQLCAPPQATRNSTSMFSQQPLRTLLFLGFVDHQHFTNEVCQLLDHGVGISANLNWDGLDAILLVFAAHL